MKFRPSAACAALALGALLPAAAAAQSVDAFVLPFGMFRLGVEAAHATHDSRFDASGNRAPITGGLGGELTPSQLVVLQPLATGLDEFLTATAGGAGASADPLDPQAISLGLLDLAAAENRTEAKARLAVGILPRLEIGAAVGLSRGGRLYNRLGLAGGTLGTNPDVTGNTELLGGIGWPALGSSDFLPTADSPLGIELQNRVTALTGTAMSLPTVPADLALLQTLLADQYGLPSLESRTQPARLGDVEIDARGLLLSTFGDAPVPVDPSGIHLRVALTAAARLATAEEPDTLQLFAAEPSEGLSAVSAGGAADLFVGPRLWFTGAMRLTWPRETEVTRRVAPRDAPLSVVVAPTPVKYAPGAQLEVRIAPRFRLAEAIALGVEYVFTAVGDSRYSDGGDGVDATILDLEGGSLQRIGVGIRYSSLPSFVLGGASLPAEVMLGYHRTIGGPEGWPAGGVVTVSASVLPRIW